MLSTVKNLFGEFMNAMIKKLLQGQAVEWKSLGEVANYEQPTKYLVKSKEYDDDFKTPVLTAGKTFILGYTNETNGIYQASKNPVIIFDDFTTANKWVNFDFKAKSSAMKMITSVDENQFLLKYIYYWLNTLPSGLVDSDHKRQWISNFANKKIPIPPLSVQSHIVQILDTFTELTTELTAELTAELSMRQKQYQYYRDLLLSEHELAKVGFEWKTLGEVGDILDNLRKPIKASLRLAGSNPYYGANNIQDYVDGFTHDGEYVLIAEDGSSSLENYSIQWATGKFWANNHVHVVSAKECLNNRFLFHFLKSMNFIPYLTGGTRAKLTKAKMIEIPIPIPPLSVQSQIVQILDTFDSLTNSISDGLPKEIKLRQKQYEYYREQLLNFTATI